jgi:hypothetical protein
MAVWVGKRLSSMTGCNQSSAAGGQFLALLPNWKERILFMQQQQLRVDTQPERTDIGSLFHPSRLFAVWYDDVQGPVLAYHMDEHTFERVNRALHDACSWARLHVGGRALVYRRDSGNVVAQYAHLPDGMLACRVYTKEGNLIWERNGHVFEGTQADWVAMLGGKERQRFKTTFYVEEAQLYLAWEDYNAAKRALLHCLETYGLSTASFKHALLAEILQQFSWTLTDEDSREDELFSKPSGRISLSRPSYDAGTMFLLLHALSMYLAPRSYLKARVGERRFVMQFRPGYEPRVTHEERPQEDHPAPVPTYAITHPDEGVLLEVHSLAEFEQGALDVLLWYLIFVLRGGEFSGWRYEDREPNDSAIWKVVSLVVPQAGECDRLRVLIDFASCFFSDATIPFHRSVAPADLTRENVWQHVRRLCCEHWRQLLEQARFLACE